MQTAIDEVKKLLDELPEDATLEDIQYHIYVIKKIRRGLKDVEDGKILDDETINKRMSQWLGE
ncbi:MAG: hypothetical protein HQM16_16360 [Deltaproteobacteria bacterium]|nr:hypothetical protein [Deltaproteobacteria bacterium]